MAPKALILNISKLIIPFTPRAIPSKRILGQIYHDWILFSKCECICFARKQGYRKSFPHISQQSSRTLPWILSKYISRFDCRVIEAAYGRSMVVEKEIDEIERMGRLRKQNEDVMKSRKAEDGIENVERGCGIWVTGSRNVEADGKSLRSLDLSPGTSAEGVLILMRF
jgi:hypothetical protein